MYLHKVIKYKLLLLFYMGVWQRKEALLVRLRQLTWRINGKIIDFYRDLLTVEISSIM